MSKVEQVMTILNFKYNNEIVRDAMCSYIQNICVVSKIICMHRLGCTVHAIVTNKYLMSYVFTVEIGRGYSLWTPLTVSGHLHNFVV